MTTLNIDTTQYICQFCMNEWTGHEYFCPYCREYKGIMTVSDYIDTYGE